MKQSRRVEIPAGYTNFAGAAEALPMTQLGLSREIQMLEGYHGGKVF